MEILPDIIAWMKQEYILLIIIAIAGVTEFVLNHLKKSLKTLIYAQYYETTDPKHAEYYLEYYKKSQVIDMIRVLVLLFTIISLIILKTGSGGSFLAVAAGALVITFKDLLLSAVAFFYVVPKYPIGTTIRIQLTDTHVISGQVIFIRIMSVGIIGKNQLGENEGRLYFVPTYRLLSDVIAKESLDIDVVRVETVKIPYKYDEFEGDFVGFIKNLQEFLKTICPIKNKDSVGNYPSFIGHRYKLDYDYIKDEYIEIVVRFVGSHKKNIERKQKIINYIESQRVKAGASVN